MCGTAKDTSHPTCMDACTYVCTYVSRDLCEHVTCLSAEALSKKMYICSLATLHAITRISSQLWMVKSVQMPARPELH